MGIPHDEISPRISTSFMVVVFSWILIVRSFISWELTSQIDVSLNWVLVRDTWGITLLTLACLCCSASGDVLFALMGSINSASLSIIIVLLLARGSSIWSTLIYSFIYSPETLFCIHSGVIEGIYLDGIKKWQIGSEKISTMASFFCYYYYYY